LGISDSHVRALFAPALVFIACCIGRAYQTDLWHHLARGKVIVEEGKILDEDRFTYTIPGQPFQDVNWLTQVAMYHLYQLGGLELLQVVNAALLALVMALLIALCRNSSGSMLVAAGIGIFTFLGLWQLFLIRPQTLSFVLFMSLYAVMEGAERRPWLLLLAPLHLALWVNVHGAFPIGIVLIGCYLLAAGIEEIQQKRWRVFRDRRVWLLAACLGVSMLATLVNPYGWRVYQYVALTSGRASARGIQEWLPPGLELFIGKVWVLSLVGVVILLSLPRSRPSARQVSLLAIFLIPACGSVRMIAWWLLVLAPIASSLIAQACGLSKNPVWSQQRGDESPRSPPNVGAALTCLALLAVMVLSLPWFERWSPLGRLARTTHRPEQDLEEVVVRLRELGRPGNIFTRFEWGEYLAWRLGPDYRIFMDGRIEIFPNDIWEEYMEITIGGARWQQLLDKYKVEYLLIDVDPYHLQLRKAVESSPRVWERVSLQTETMLLFRKRASPRAEK
jgi:hypothetical protein